MRQDSAMIGTPARLSCNDNSASIILAAPLVTFDVRLFDLHGSSPCFRKRVCFMSAALFDRHGMASGPWTADCEVMCVCVWCATVSNKPRLTCCWLVAGGCNPNKACSHKSANKMLKVQSLMHHPFHFQHANLTRILQESTGSLG